jgi:hypothetical protein
MKTTLKIKVIIAGILVLFMIISATPAVAQTNARKVDTVEFSIDFSTPICQHACPHHQSNRLVACSVNFVSLGGHALRGKSSTLSIDPLGCEIFNV